MSQIYTGVAAQRVIDGPDRSVIPDDPSCEIWQFVGFAPVDVATIQESWPMGGLVFGQDPAIVQGIDYDGTFDWTGSGDFPYRIRGFARDSTGAVLGGAIMQLYRSSDEAFIRSSVSDSPSGQYDLGVEDTVTQYFVVARRYGPDVQGVTIDTLVGS